nr:hypothetical protein [Mycoplasmopsis bovis]
MKVQNFILQYRKNIMKKKFMLRVSGATLLATPVVASYHVLMKLI